MKLRRAGVVGAGVMGTGIVRHLLGAGVEVVVVDSDPGKLAAAAEQYAASPVRCSAEADALADAALVIEAVFEDLELKRDVLARLSTVCREDCVLASNTSSLLIEDMVPAVHLPHRFLGVHYNNPADTNPVVEIVAAKQTAPSIAAEVTAWYAASGKLAIPCRDTIGFVLNRQSLPYINEAVRCLEIATPGQIDEIATTRLGMGLGPFSVMNLVGINVMGAASRNLARLGSGYAAAPVLLDRAFSNKPWTVETTVAFAEPLATTVSERLLGAIVFAGRDLLNRAICNTEGLHRICTEALGYARSSPQLLEALSADEVERLVALYLSHQHSATRAPSPKGNLQG